MPTAEQIKHHKDRATKFKEQQETGIWPADTCETCRASGWTYPKGPNNLACCQRHHHHHLSMCLHCGDDERSARAWRFR